MLTHQQQTAFEDIVGKEEIACNEQFLLFPQCFQLNQITVSPFVHIFDILSLSLSQQALVFMCLQCKSFENIMEIGNNCS